MTIEEINRKQQMLLIDAINKRMTLLNIAVHHSVVGARTLTRFDYLSAKERVEATSLLSHLENKIKD